MNNDVRFTKIIKSSLGEVLLKAWSKTVSGNNFVMTTPISKTAYMSTLRGLVDNELEGILEYLAMKQNVQLEDYNRINSDSTLTDQLKFIKILTENISRVQNNKHCSITPRISRDLNGLDCSMSTWVMQHETKKAGLGFKWGAPIGHAVGILNLSGGDTYYADGQNGFVEKIDVTETPVDNGAIVLTINNYEKIQERQTRFFPKFVLSGSNVDIASTMTNIDSMIYKQYIGEITPEMKIKLGKDLDVVTQMQPYAIEFLQIMSQFNKNESKTVINEVIDELFPELEKFRNLHEVKMDKERLNNPQN